MAYLINEVITLGIGTPSDIPSFILVGLATNASPPPSPSAMSGLTGNSGSSGMSGGTDDWDVE